MPPLVFSSAWIRRHDDAVMQGAEFALCHVFLAGRALQSWKNLLILQRLGTHDAGDAPAGRVIGGEGPFYQAVMAPQQDARARHRSGRHNAWGLKQGLRDAIIFVSKSR